MKQNTFIKIVIAVFIIGFSSNVFAQRSIKTIEIKTSGDHEKSKELIEQSLAVEKGVKSFEFKENTTVVVVNYRENKTTPDKIRTAISEAGFDADDVKADPKAVKLLPSECTTKSACCSKKGK